MSRVTLTPELQDDYLRLFTACVIREEWAAHVEARVETVWAERNRYKKVGEPLNIPWFVVAALHQAESDGDFTVHLHNGDPLTERTQHLPAERPAHGEPPFCWEDSARDALQLRHIDAWSDWSIAGTLFLLEGYNGWGYRLHHPEVASPYLWNGSTYYTQGKYVVDGAWSETGVAQRCGAAVLLRRQAECGMIKFAVAEHALSSPLLRYDEASFSPWAEALQRFLNALPGIYVKVDGRAGRRTSAAFRQVVGVYLPGDPRLTSPD